MYTCINIDRKPDNEFFYSSINIFFVQLETYQRYWHHNKLHFGGEVPDISKYVQKGYLLTDMCKEEQMQWV